MAVPKKVILKELSLWKKRLNTSKRVLNGAYKEISKDVKKVYKQAHPRA